MMNLTVLASQPNLGSTSTSRDLNNLITDSIKNVLEHVFMHLAATIIIIVSCRRSDVEDFYLDIEEHLSRTVDYMAIQLVNFKREQSRKIDVDGSRIYSVLMLVDSFQAFLDIDIAAYTLKHDSPEYYYILFEQSGKNVDHPHDMQTILEYCWHHQLINCNVQIQQATGELVMYTYYPFTPGHCNVVTPVRINHFVGSKWNNSEVFPNKLNNFQQCPLKVAVREQPPFLEVKRLNGKGNSKSLQLSGLEGELLRQLSRKFNFSMEIIQSFKREKTGGNALNTNTLGLLKARLVDMAVGYVRRRSSKADLTTSTFPHYQSAVVASILLSAHSLSTHEILVFPFQYYSWLAILTAFAGSMLAVLSLYRLHRRYIGPRLNIRHGVLLFSMITTLLGSPLTKEPQERLERCFYSSWIVATFILRTMYSALLFHLFRNSPFHRLPNRLSEIFDWDYTAVLSRYTLNDLPKATELKRIRFLRPVVLNSTHENEVFSYLEKHAADNLVAFTLRDFLVNYVTSGHLPDMFRIIPENVMNLHLTIHLTKHSFLVEEFDAFIMRIKAVGLMEIWTRWHLNDEYFRNHHLNPRKLIGQCELNGIYMVLAILYGIALVIFGLELFSKKNKVLKMFLIKRNLVDN